MGKAAGGAGVAAERDGLTLLHSLVEADERPSLRDVDVAAESAVVVLDKEDVVVFALPGAFGVNVVYADDRPGAHGDELRSDRHREIVGVPGHALM